MASGISVNDAVKILFNNMKVNKTCDLKGERIRLASFIIGKDENDKDAIILEECLIQKDVEQGKCAFKEFRRKLEDGKCRYILYDCHYTKDNSNKEELISFMWCSPKARIKDKMIYASSNNALKKVFTGIKHKEFHDCEQGNPEEFFGMLGANVETVEGKDRRCHMCTPRDQSPQGRPHKDQHHSPRGGRDQGSDEDQHQRPRGRHDQGSDEDQHQRSRGRCDQGSDEDLDQRSRGRRDEGQQRMPPHMHQERLGY